jgi:glutathione synthase/RimK-type ligase-like ATP-grasp enzyme
MQRTWGLNFGAYDFIVSLQDEYCFLEVNSMGNWLWLENETGVPTSHHIGEWVSGQ